MQRMGMSEDQRRSDYRRSPARVLVLISVLTSEEACDIALDYGLDPTVDDEQAFDILPE